MAARTATAQPIRRWLALALVTVLVVPVLVVVVFAILWVGDEPHEPREDAIAVLRDGADRWQDTEWQQAVSEELAEDDVDFVLMEGDREIFRSAEDPLAEGEVRVVERITIDGASPSRVAVVYAPEESGPPEEVPVKIIPFVGLGALVLTLGGIAWFLGRAVLDPLAATGEAAREVSRGNLDVALPTSRVREVADVNAAFEAMSADLRSSLRQQAAMEEERRHFIAAIAHDLRTPLFSLRGYLEGMEQGLADTEEKRRRYLAVAQEKATALEYLIADLFDFTRLEYLDQAPDLEWIDLGEMLRRFADGVHPLADAREISLQTDFPDRECPVDGDERLLTRVLDNLIDNALRHTPPGGSVTIACRPQDGRVEFSVADSGPGVPEQDLDKLFTPMFRGETSRNRGTGGAGLGLAIARRIMRAHGGDLTVENASDGGAVFTASMPCRVRASAEQRVNRQ